MGKRWLRACPPWATRGCKCLGAAWASVGKLRHRAGDSMWLCSSGKPGQGGGSHPHPRAKNKPEVLEEGGKGRGSGGSTHVPCGETRSGPSLGDGIITGFSYQPHPSSAARGRGAKAWEMRKCWGSGLRAGSHPGPTRGRILPAAVGRELQVALAAFPAPAAPHPSRHPSRSDLAWWEVSAGTSPRAWPGA